jgi:hypothetical protein
MAQRYSIERNIQCPLKGSESRRFEKTICSTEVMSPPDQTLTINSTGVVAGLCYESTCGRQWHAGSDSPGYSSIGTRAGESRASHAPRGSQNRGYGNRVSER